MSVFQPVVRSTRIAWIAVRELFYERVFYILLTFAVASLGASLMLGQLTYAEQAKLTLDFMLGGMQLSMILFSVFMGISLFQRELTLGSVSMVLSKPISRGTFLLGKFLGQLTVQTLVISAMALMTLAVSAANSETVPVAAILQTVILILFEVSVVTAVTYFFAVNAGAITTAVATFCVFGVGHLGDAVASNVDKNASALAVWRMVRGIFPDLEVFNMKALASYGIAIAWGEMGWATLYAVICTTFFLFSAIVCFDRKDILT